MRKTTMRLLTLTLLTLFLTSQIITGQNCGIERWSIKTLSDKDTLKINFKNIIPTTVHEQVSLESPKEKKSRLTSESNVYSIDCFIVGFKKESNDKDIHIIIEDIETDETMVAEIPSYECFEIQKTSRYELFKQLQEWFIINIGQPKSNFVFLENIFP